MFSLNAGLLYNTLVVCESLVLLACSLYGFFKYLHDDTIITMTLLVGIYCNIYLLYFSISSLRNEDSFQMGLSCFVHIILCCVSSFHYWMQIEGANINTILLIMWATTIACQVAYFILTPRVIQSFGMRMFEKVGALVENQRMYKLALVFFTLLRLDTFLSFYLVLQLSMKVLEKPVHMETLVNVFSGVATLLWVFVGYRMVYREKTLWTVIWTLTCFLQPIYICYKAYVILSTNSYYSDNIYPTDAKIQYLMISLLWLLLRVGTIIFFFFKVYSNFGKGLKSVWDNEKIADIPFIGDYLPPIINNGIIGNPAQDAEKKRMEEDQVKVKALIESTKRNAQHGYYDENNEFIMSFEPVEQDHINVTLNNNTNDNNNQYNTTLYSEDYNAASGNASPGDDVQGEGLEQRSDSMLYEDFRQKKTLNLPKKNKRKK